MDRLKTRHFARWSKKAGINDERLSEAAIELEAGGFAANLGAGLYKVRIARKNSGRSSGFRTLVAYRERDRVLFLFGFAKNERDNVDQKELAAFKKLGKDYLSLRPAELHRAIEMGILIELE